jgi:prepilin-type processing-associated H-X9-DG protein
MSPVVTDKKGETSRLFVPGVLPVEFSDDQLKDMHVNLHVYRDLLLCPSAKKAAGDPPGDPFGGNTCAAWWQRQGSELEAPTVVSSYGQNAWVAGDPLTLKRPCWTTCLIKDASAVPVYLDSRGACAYPFETEAPPAYENMRIVATSMAYFVIDRHSGGVNALFMDWSVRKVGLKELWTLKWGPDFNTAGPWTKAGGVQPDQWPQWMRKFKDY